jgi:hypothetical protein
MAEKVRSLSLIHTWDAIAEEILAISKKI